MVLNEASQFFWAGLFVTSMFVAALNSKALGASIAFCLGLATVYPASGTAMLLVVFYIPAVLLANFRD